MKRKRLWKRNRGSKKKRKVIANKNSAQYSHNLGILNQNPFIRRPKKEKLKYNQAEKQLFLETEINTKRNLHIPPVPQKKKRGNQKKKKVEQSSEDPKTVLEGSNNANIVQLEVTLEEKELIEGSNQQDIQDEKTRILKPILKKPTNPPKQKRNITFDPKFLKPSDLEEKPIPAFKSRTSPRNASAHWEQFFSLLAQKTGSKLSRQELLISEGIVGDENLDDFDTMDELLELDEDDSEDESEDEKKSDNENEQNTEDTKNNI